MIGRNVIEICTGEALRIFTDAYPSLGKAIDYKTEAYGDTLKITFDAKEVDAEVPLTRNDNEGSISNRNGFPI